ncbi:hypothetical protein Bca52824_095197 [Brassica carinata]|uniref:Uncharacterized protein n=1 Tax=Brassica carinata TaxID=52824 RepID=A0A8X7P1T0_BRACI|nr:hypothetical protein Bca52824_095197 [Brassica carinata]
MIGSGKASETLLMLYAPFMGIGILATLRGLVSRSTKSTGSVDKRSSTVKPRRNLSIEYQNLALVVLLLNESDYIAMVRQQRASKVHEDRYPSYETSQHHRGKYELVKRDMLDPPSYLRRRSDISGKATPKTE